MMSRRSCSGGRPKSTALPRRSNRQAARTGSINSQGAGASDRSLGDGRGAGMLPAYRPGPSPPSRTATTTKTRGREGQASWDETGINHVPDPAGRGGSYGDATAAARFRREWGRRGSPGR